ncbi:hypothetical protein H4R35_007069, partial [Dimargaris xerosporica]
MRALLETPATNTKVHACLVTVEPPRVSDEAVTFAIKWEEELPSTGWDCPVVEVSSHNIKHKAEKTLICNKKSVHFDPKTAQQPKMVVPDPKPKPAPTYKIQAWLAEPDDEEQVLSKQGAHSSLVEVQ